MAAQYDANWPYYLHAVASARRTMTILLLEGTSGANHPIPLAPPP